MESNTIVLLEGDETGQELLEEALRVLQPEVVGLLPVGAPSTMPWLVEQCLERDLTVAAWAISEDWIDVGTPADLARAKGQL